VRAAVGTPAFLAPEIAGGGAARGEPSDVWSLGVCLFYIVTGDVPFPGSTVDSVVAKITRVPGDGDGERAEDPGAFLETLNGGENGLSPSLRDLLRRVLDKRPETRADLHAIAKHAWVTNGGALDPVDLGVDIGEDKADRSAKENGASPRVSLDVSERDVADSISYERVRGFHDASVATYRTFERGEFLIKQGERGDEMFVILSGEVEVVTAQKSGAGDDDDDDDEVDMSDDIVAAAMMNREEDFEDSGESSKRLERARGENDNATAGSLGGWLSCCFGSAERIESAPSAHVLIATRGAGDIVGEMSLLTPGASSLRSASVRARSREVRCSVISKEELWRSLRERPEALEELRLRSVGRESELIVGRALLSTGAAAATSP
jgi:CRP-like cAMP-binding protein